MAITFSTPLKNDILDTDSLKALLDDGYLKIYSGTVPANADAALGSAVLLVSYSDNNQGEGAGQGLDFEASAANGAITKAAAQTWSGTSTASAATDGAGTFFRYVKASDGGGSATTELRIQGTVGGAGADMFVQSTSFSNSTLYTVDYFSIAIPL